MNKNYTVICDDTIHQLFYEATFDAFCRFGKDEQSNDADVIFGARIMATKMLHYLEEQNKKYEKVKNPSAD